MARARTCVLRGTSLALVLGVATASAAVALPDERSRLDLHRIAGFRGPSNDLRVTMMTVEEWPTKLVREGSRNRLFVLFDSDRDGRTEYKGRIVLDAGSLEMRFNGPGHDPDPVPVTRPDRRTVRAIVPDGYPMNPSRSINIAGSSRYFGNRCRPCVDRVPDRGWVRLPRVI